MSDINHNIPITLRWARWDPLLSTWSVREQSVNRACKEWNVSIDTISDPKTLNIQLPWTVVSVSFPVYLSNTSVQMVWRESMKQLRTTPLTSIKQGESWQHPCIEIRHVKNLWIAAGILNENQRHYVNACLVVFVLLLLLLSFCIGWPNRAADLVA